MEEKIETEMYVRTFFGISKIIKTDKLSDIDIVYLDNKKGNIYFKEYQGVCVNDVISKPSYDITDLIEPMDLIYVDIDDGYSGGIIVPRIAETQKELDEFMELIKNGKWILKGVVTKEQLESEAYNI